MLMNKGFWMAHRSVAAILAVAVIAAAGLSSAQDATAPLTLPFLKLMPKQSALAIGIPPLNVIEGKLVPLLEKVAPELDAAGAIEDFVADAAIDLGIDADNLNDLGKKLGLDLDAPITIFIDASPTLKSVDELKAKLGDNPEASAIEDAIEDNLAIPAITIVLGVSDAKEAEASVEDISSMLADIDPATLEKIAAGDVTVKSAGPEKFNFFLADNKLVLGNSLDMVANTALRLKDPASIRYGSPECPAIATDELSFQLFGGDFVPALMAALSMFQNQDPTTKALVEKQMQLFSAVWEGEGATDPMVLSLVFDDSRLELISRMDTVKHPAVLTQSGTAAALKYAPMLADNTSLMLSLYLTPEIKKMLSEMVLDTMAAQATGDPGMAQGLTMGRQVLQMLGPEVTLGLAPATDDLPAAVLMLGLTNPEATKGLLQMLVPTMPEETYKEVEISSIAAGIPVPLSIAYPGDFVLVSSNIDEMKRIIDLLKEEKTSELFSKLNPALDPSVARYSALVLKTSLYTDVIQPLSVLIGGLPAEADEIVTRVAAAVDELRLVQEMKGDWQMSSLRLSLK